MAYQKFFIGPLVWKCFTNDLSYFERKGISDFLYIFMYINVHGHQIFAKCTLNECTKMELDPPQIIPYLGSNWMCRVFKLTSLLNTVYLVCDVLFEDVLELLL